jgi:antitoxin MazE
MKADLVQIGNSRGIRIPKAFIQQCKLGEKVDIRVEGDRIIIARERQPREDWEERFQSAEDGVSDKLLFPEFRDHKFDRDEWTW